MNMRNRNLMTLALATALVSPLAAAQTETTQGELDAQEQATEALPPQANPVGEGEQVDPRVPVDEEDPMNAVPPPAPVQAQDDTGATGQSDVAQDARWTELDANGDGRIDAQEAAVDMDFNASFEMMDADGDGFVTDAEFRTHSTTSPPSDDGSMESMDHDGMDQDGMDSMDVEGTDDGTGTMDDGIDDPIDG